ncbi:ATP-binding protein [Pedobacter insulae]|uniref:ATP-dependent DNA helicase RecG n=1 Tax=Pedobacter insulae TaxID=414048 RepID=A0A1I2ZAY8_9SPHI|nr:ATP-binding protein [Pedobacter insulae]SFH35028.1 ATP-dependent DNA helicase RecG [Pedobacter insulae]
MNLAFDPEKYMKLAVEIMKKSIQEPREDKTSPKVGAVLVSPNGEVLDTAFRGELRDGDHAEFTLLERKNRNKGVTGCYLFATLEPCAPGARKHPKLGCAERIVNARIAKVWIGIADPDPTVDRKGIKYLESKNVEVEMFRPEFQKQIKKENEEFLKQAIQRAEDVKVEKVIVLNKLDELMPATDLSIFDKEALDYYIKSAGLGFTSDSEDFKRHLAQLELIIPAGNTYMATGAALLLFGKDPRAAYQNAVVKAKIKYGSNAPIPKDFDGPLVLIPRGIEMWLQQVLHSQVSREKFERQTQAAYPLEPLREAIINALVHRDYEIEGAKTYIEIDDDKILVKSAGLPVSPISLDQVKQFKASSLSRNPKITYIFNKMKLMEENELGMETFRTMQEKHNLPLPEFSYTEPYLALTFPRTLEAVKSVSIHKGIEELTVDEIKGYEWIKSKTSVSRKEYQNHLRIEERTANRHLKRFIRLGLIGDNGESPKSNKYRYVFIG